MDSVESLESSEPVGARRRRRRPITAILFGRRHPLMVAGVALALAAVVLLPSCSAGRKRLAARIPVSVATAEQRAMPYEIVATGTVEPLQTASVGSEVGGVVTRVGFQEGSEVRQGQLLFQLDPSSYQAALDQARAVLHRDVAQAENARANAERAAKLLAQNFISPEEYQGDTTSARALEAQVQSDSAALETARLNLEYAAIRAPISGRTGRLLVHAGDYVKSGTTDPLVTINQVHPILVQFAVPERELHEVQRFRDRRLEVTAIPSAHDSLAVRGTLSFIDNAVDPNTGTILLKAEFPNRDERLWPGEFVEVHLVLYVEPHATVIPEAAVTTAQSGTFVYVVNPDSTVTSRPVTVTRTTDQQAIIGSGVKPGEQVVIDGQLKLGPGARVQITPPVAPVLTSDS